MIKVHVPELKAEDVERVREGMQAFEAALRTMAPLIATALLQMSQQVGIIAQTFRAQVEYEAKRREDARLGTFPCMGAEMGVCGGVPHTIDCPSYAEQEAPRGRG